MADIQTMLTQDSIYLIAGCTFPLPLLPLPLVGVVALGPWALPGLWGREPTIRPVFGSIRNLLRISEMNGSVISHSVLY